MKSVLVSSGGAHLGRSDEALDDMNGSEDHFRRMIDAIP
jgi:hypothetical protein